MVSLSVRVTVCVSVRQDITGTTRAIFTNFLHIAYVRDWSCSGKLTIGRIAYRREGGDGSAQRGRCVIYDCLVCRLRYAVQRSWLPRCEDGERSVSENLRSVGSLRHAQSATTQRSSCTLTCQFALRVQPTDIEAVRHA